MSRPLVLCFIGPDGSGKTTLKDALQKHLESEGSKVESLWWLDSERTPLRRLLRRLSGTPDPRPSLQGPPPPKRSTLVAEAYALVVRLESLRFAHAQVRARRRRADVVLLDRSFFDHVLYAAEEFAMGDARVDRIVRRYRRLLPRVDLYFFVEAPAQLCFSRKPADYRSLEVAEQRAARYARLARLLDAQGERVRTLDTTKPLEAGIAQVVDAANGLRGNWTRG